jgi:hypothetical protein
MPDECHFTGMSMNGATPANATISVELGCDFAPAHAENRTAEIHVLARAPDENRIHLDQS